MSIVTKGYGSKLIVTKGYGSIGFIPKKSKSGVSRLEAIRTYEPRGKQKVFYEMDRGVVVEAPPTGIHSQDTVPCVIMETVRRDEHLFTSHMGHTTLVKGPIDHDDEVAIVLLLLELTR